MAVTEVWTKTVKLRISLQNNDATEENINYKN